MTESAPKLRLVPQQAAREPSRVTVRGRGFWAGDERLRLHGLSYMLGSAPAARRPHVVGEELQTIARLGVNALHVRECPPGWFLDLAASHGLHVLVGVPWHQDVACLEDRDSALEAERAVRQVARAGRDHPALLGLSIGDRIPSSIVRWHGRRRVEAWLRELVEIARSECPQALVTYVNHPPTEFLELPCLDFLCFQMDLAEPDAFDAYLARLHNLADALPLVLTDVAPEAGGSANAATGWRVRRALDTGCAGTFALGWPPPRPRAEKAGERVHGALPSPAPPPLLQEVARIYARPGPALEAPPRVSVVCCSYNGETTIRDTLEALAQLDYPDYEVIVVDDGSTDATAEIAREHGVRVVSTAANQGLSAARNEGLRAARGEIVAYIDDDAYPEPDWLRYLVHAFQQQGWCGVGGPNLLPIEDGPLAECVYNAPGGPCHVLVSDREAEHVPGCNMAFWRSWLEHVGGFDPRFRSAGDDVDLCWRLQEAGGRIGFHAAAVVWHHRRDSLTRYWRQQVGYGAAEGLLARKWPQRYNSAGHVPWSGRIYGRGLTRPLLERSGRIYQGVWGNAPFQSVHRPAAGRLLSLTLLPEWYLVIAGLAALAALGSSWPPLAIFAPLCALAVVALVAQALRSAAGAPLRRRWSVAERRSLRAVIAWLHLVQPAARLWGRLRHGLDPWRMRGRVAWVAPRSRRATLTTGRPRDAAAWLAELESRLRDGRVLVRRGGPFDPFDLRLAGGPFGGARVRMAVESSAHGATAHVRSWPAVTRLPILAAPALLAAAALAAGATLAGGLLGLGALGLLLGTLRECGAAQAQVAAALRTMQETEEAGDGLAAADGV